MDQHYRCSMFRSPSSYIHVYEFINQTSSFDVEILVSLKQDVDAFCASQHISDQSRRALLKAVGTYPNKELIAKGLRRLFMPFN